MNKTILLNRASISVLLAATLSSTAQSQTIDEIIVTATKQAESTQDIPVTVTALDGAALDELNVDVFTDYLLQLPGVTAGGGGPGQGTIYIRGAASTTPNITVAGVAGIAPNVALYLDEQPVTQVGRNLDVYAADLNRVEVLSGPQGTLFGASSQAGTVRLITNKPDLNNFSASTNFGVSFTEGGEMSEKLEAVLNVPVVEGKFAVRGVFYVDQQGGYIDNVPGTIDISQSARFQSAGVRSNGSPFGDGIQGGADLSNATLEVSDNILLVEDNYNDTTYTGARLSATLNLNDNWSIDVSHTRQELDTEGVFFHDPTLGDSDDLSIQRFAPERLEDKFNNTAWTVKGELAGLEAVYTGAFLNRNSEQLIDYTDYLFVGQYLPYYLCDFSVTYPGAAPISGTCGVPQLTVDSTTEAETFTQELRFSTPQDKRLRALVGGYYSSQDVVERVNGIYPGSVRNNFPQNGPLPGSNTDPNPRPIGVTFFNDVTRQDEQLALFGEVSFDVVPEVLEVTLGARVFDNSVDFIGSSNSAFGNFGSATDNQIGGASLDELFSGNTVQNGITIPDEAVSKGEIFKANVSWTPNSNMLFYATYSEGFRPGLLNRPAGVGGIVPAVVDTDDLQNYELGWKLDLLDNTLRFNGSAFLADIKGLQSNIFDPNITIFNFSDNAADAQIKGVEGDVTWAASNNLTLAGAFSFLDTEIQEILTQTTAIAPVGSDLSYAPSFQGNLRARYEWDIKDDLGAFIQPQITYSASSFGDIILQNRAEQDAYTLLNLSTGITKDNWSMTLFGENLTNSRAQLNNAFNFDRERITVVRPRTWGLRASINY